MRFTVMRGLFSDMISPSRNSVHSPEMNNSDHVKNPKIAGSHTTVWMQENTAHAGPALKDRMWLPKRQGELKMVRCIIQLQHSGWCATSMNRETQKQKKNLLSLKTWSKAWFPQGANWLKIAYHQGRSLGKIFSVSGILCTKVGYLA